MTILSGDATKYYTPKHELAWRWARNTEMNALQLDIRYEGPVNIEEPLIKTEYLRNYWVDPDIIAKAKQKLTGCENFLADETDPFYGLLEIASMLTVVGFCVLNYHHTAAKNKLRAEIQRIANDQLSQDLAHSLEAADKIVDKLIASMQQKQQPESTDTQEQNGVKISHEHLQIVPTTLEQHQQLPQQQWRNGRSLLTRYHEQQTAGLMAPPFQESKSPTLSSAPQSLIMRA